MLIKGTAALAEVFSCSIFPYEMLMVTNRGATKSLRDVDRTRLEVKNKTSVPAVYSCAFRDSPLRTVPVKAK